MLKNEEDSTDREVLQNISTRIDELFLNMEKMGIAEYLEMLRHPRHMMWTNFWIGVARGFGMAVGFTVLAALFIYLLKQVILLNIPHIGQFIADIIDIVQTQLK